MAGQAAGDLQELVLAFAWTILMDRRPEPIFPRWLGYLSLWTALGLAPAGIVVLFKHGAFAWNGLFGFFVPLTVFCIWVAATTVGLLKAVRADDGT